MAMQEVPIALHVHPINVGQGDAILLEIEYSDEKQEEKSPASFKRYLIDGGQGQEFSKTLYNETGVVTPFNNLITALNEKSCIRWDQPNQQRIELDSIVNTHPDDDHCGGINALLGSKKIKSVKKFTFSCPIITTNAARLRAYIPVNERTYRYGPYRKAGDCPRFWFPNARGLVIENLHQQSTVQITKDDLWKGYYNETSILTTVKIPKSKYDYDVVLTGDSSSKIILDTLTPGLMLEKDMPRKTVRIFQVPHHGSRNNSCYEFYKQFDADIYFISHGVHGKFKHPHSEVITGILSAAVEKKQKQKSRIVVTATWFEESKINYFYRKRIRHWRDFVKIYYFKKGTPYVTLDWSKSRPKGLIKYTEREEKKQREGTENVICHGCYKECDRLAKNYLCAKCLTCTVCEEFTDEFGKLTAVCNRCGSRAHANAETKCTIYISTPRSYYCIKCRKCTICNQEIPDKSKVKVKNCGVCKARAHVSCVQGISTGASKYKCCGTRSMSHNPHERNVIEVNRDGNCFFNSMAINIKNKPDKWQHLGISLNKENSIISRYLRLVLVCELLGVRRPLYEEFFAPENLALENYEEEVKKFLTLTFFDSLIGDFMPGALAKALNCSIVIYFKDSGRKWTIEPTEGGTIPTAYLIYNRDGYDAVIP